MQGKWDDAQREYEDILEEHPDAPSIHYLLGRLLLSRPDGDAQSAERAKQEFQKELQIDPQNAGAEYILGEMARQESQWDEAITHFTRATKLDPTFRRRLHEPGILPGHAETIRRSHTAAGSRSAAASKAIPRRIIIWRWRSAVPAKRKKQKKNLRFSARLTAELPAGWRERAIVPPQRICVTQNFRKGC